MLRYNGQNASLQRSGIRFEELQRLAEQLVDCVAAREAEGGRSGPEAVRLRKRLAACMRAVHDARYTAAEGPEGRGRAAVRRAV